MLLASPGVSAPAAAQAYPAKPVRLIVPYVAGGAADIFGRVVAQKLTEAFKENFIVENRPGANGGIGAD
ncbi:MAG TPA: tripartite tricarboxylate transporter substrate binding protein, partial [Alphaproteobacteria bacterium]